MTHQEALEILELRPGATKKEIRQQYKELARKLHPDKNRVPDAEEQFKGLSAAYRKAAGLESDDTQSSSENASNNRPFRKPFFFFKNHVLELFLRTDWTRYEAQFDSFFDFHPKNWKPIDYQECLSRCTSTKSAAGIIFELLSQGDVNYWLQKSSDFFSYLYQDMTPTDRLLHNLPEIWTDNISWLLNESENDNPATWRLFNEAVAIDPQPFVEAARKERRCLSTLLAPRVNESASSYDSLILKLFQDSSTWDQLSVEAKKKVCTLSTDHNNKLFNCITSDIVSFIESAELKHILTQIQTSEAAHTIGISNLAAFIHNPLNWFTNNQVTSDPAHQAFREKIGKSFSLALSSPNISDKIIALCNTLSTDQFNTVISSPLINYAATANLLFHAAHHPQCALIHSFLNNDACLTALRRKSEPRLHVAADTNNTPVQHIYYHLFTAVLSNAFNITAFIEYPHFKTIIREMSDQDCQTYGINRDNFIPELWLIKRFGESRDPLIQALGKATPAKQKYRIMVRYIQQPTVTFADIKNAFTLCEIPDLNRPNYFEKNDWRYDLMHAKIEYNPHHFESSPWRLQRMECTDAEHKTAWKFFVSCSRKTYFANIKAVEADFVESFTNQYISIDFSRTKRTAWNFYYFDIYKLLTDELENTNTAQSKLMIDFAGSEFMRKTCKRVFQYILFSKKNATEDASIDVLKNQLRLIVLEHIQAAKNTENLRQMEWRLLSALREKLNQCVHNDASRNTKKMAREILKKLESKPDVEDLTIDNTVPRIENDWRSSWELAEQHSELHYQTRVKSFLRHRGREGKCFNIMFYKHILPLLAMRTPEKANKLLAFCENNDVFWKLIDIIQRENEPIHWFLPRIIEDNRSAYLRNLSYELIQSCTHCGETDADLSQCLSQLIETHAKMSLCNFSRESLAHIVYNAFMVLCLIFSCGLALLNDSFREDWRRPRPEHLLVSHHLLSIIHEHNVSARPAPVI